MHANHISWKEFLIIFFLYLTLNASVVQASAVDLQTESIAVTPYAADLAPLLDKNISVTSSIALVEADVFIDNFAIAIDVSAFHEPFNIFEVDPNNAGTPPYTWSQSLSAFNLDFNNQTGAFSGRYQGGFSGSIQVAITDSEGQYYQTTYYGFTSLALTPSFGEQAVDNLMCNSLVAVCATSVLPAVESFGNINNVYEVTLANGDPLPNEITYNTTTRIVSLDVAGIELNTSYELHYTATDHDGSYDSIEFNMSVQHFAAIELPSITDLTLVHQAEQATIFAAPSGGQEPLIYTIVQADGSALPQGFSFNATSGILLSNTQNHSVTDSFELLYQVTDAGGISENTTFTVSLEANLVPTIGNIASFTSYKNEQHQLSSATSGNGDLSYSLVLLNEDSVPTGLSVDASNNILSISEDIATGVYKLTSVVTDIDGDQANAIFTLTVIEDLQPSLVVSDIYLSDTLEIFLDKSFSLNELSIVSATSLGNTPSTFLINGQSSLFGLSIDSETGTLSGILDSAFEGTTFVISLTDSDNDTVNSSVFTLVPTDLQPMLTTIDNQSCVLSLLSCVFMLPQVNEQGNIRDDVSLTLADGSDLPSNILFNASSLSLEFFNDIAQAGITTNLKLTVVDYDGDSDDEFFSIVTNNQIAFNQASTRHILLNGTQVSLSYEEAIFNTGSTSYTLNGSLPAGLSFDASSLTISGVATQLISSNLTLIATDESNLSASIAIELIVQAPEQPQLVPLANQTGLLDEKLTITLTKASGNGNLNFEISTNGEPGLPEGLLLDEELGVITGIPLMLGSYNISVVVSDSDNDDTDTTITSFSLVNYAPVALVVALSESYRWYKTVTLNYTLPKMMGGAGGNFTYSLVATSDSSWPVGLVFDDQSRVLSGQISELGNYTLDYSGTDSVNNSKSFTVQVQSLALAAPIFEASFADKKIMIGEAFNWTLPQVDQEGSLDIIYELSSTPELPAGVSFNSTSRRLSGMFNSGQSYSLTYEATNSLQESSSLDFQIIVQDTDISTALVEDILAHHALAIADSTSRVVKQRMNLAGKSRAAWQEKPTRNSRGQRSRAINIETNGLLYSTWFDGYGSSLSQAAEYDWDSGLSISQFGFDISSNQWFAGILSEGAISTIDFTEADTSGSYDLDVSVTTFYGGYKTPKLSFWGASSSGSGGKFDLNIDGDTTKSELSYSALLGGLSYKYSETLDFGGDYILDATLTSDDAQGSANRLNAYIDWNFAKLTNKHGKVWLRPKINGALRLDGGAATQSGIDVSISSIMKLGDQFFLDAGLRLLLINFGGDLSETSYWFSALWQPNATGFGAKLSQRLGQLNLDSNSMASGLLLSDLSLEQAEQVTLQGELSYSWLLGKGDMKLYSRGSGLEYLTAINSKATVTSMFSERLGLNWSRPEDGFSLEVDYLLGRQDKVEQLGELFAPQNADLQLKARITLP